MIAGGVRGFMCSFIFLIEVNLLKVCVRAEGLRLLLMTSAIFAV